MPENIWISIPVFWSSFFFFNIHWSGTGGPEKRHRVTSGILYLIKTVFLGELFLADDSAEQSFFLSFRMKIINSIAIWMCLNANQKICNTHSLQKQSRSLGLAESNYFRLPPLLPHPFPWARWRCGITFDEIQNCRSIHHGIKICSGKCSSCIFNSLHFLLS